MMSSLTMKYLLSKINYLKPVKNLKNRDFCKIYKQNLQKVMKILKIKYLLIHGLIWKK